jgi:apolipoprotein N-acyltransferase
MSHFDISYRILNSILPIIGIYILLKSNRYQAFVFGFFVGIFWFYWIPISFIHYGFPILMPFGIAIIALFYGFLFYVVGWLKSIYVKSLAIVLISFVHPFGFDWLIMNLPFVESYFGVEIWQFVIILISIILFIVLPKKIKFYSLVLIMLSLDYSGILSLKSKNEFPLKTKIITTHIDQSQKWLPEFTVPVIYQNIGYIDSAIKNGYELIVLPEAAFTVAINISPTLMATLKEKSREIAIVTGGIRYENNKAYNSTYLFDNGFVQIFNKKFLVPFGEEIPLPDILSNFINKVFFNEVEDFGKAKTISTFKIKNIRFVNAICYEATKRAIHQGGDSYIIAISNNGWFAPSTEPTLQKLIIKYLSKQYNSKVIHSVNMSSSYTINTKLP